MNRIGKQFKCKSCGANSIFHVGWVVIYPKFKPIFRCSSCSHGFQKGNDGKEYKILCLTPQPYTTAEPLSHVDLQGNLL